MENVMNHHSYTMMRQSHARIAEADRNRSPTSFGLPAPPPRATREAADEARRLVEDLRTPQDIRAAAGCIVRSFEHNSPLRGEDVQNVIKYMHRRHEQNRWGK
jgi:hypothetical protein